MCITRVDLLLLYGRAGRRAAISVVSGLGSQTALGRRLLHNKTSAKPPSGKHFRTLLSGMTPAINWTFRPRSAGTPGLSAKEDSAWLACFQLAINTLVFRHFRRSSPSSGPGRRLEPMVATSLLTGEQNKQVSRKFFRLHAGSAGCDAITPPASQPAGKRKQSPCFHFEPSRHDGSRRWHSAMWWNRKASRSQPSLLPSVPRNLGDVDMAWRNRLLSFKLYAGVRSLK
jgi:hypothetical protein